tara:strand:+ start:77 stop:193 length:117 start_codon:yes stop_codon:yes gene_type:complete
MSYTYSNITMFLNVLIKAHSNNFKYIDIFVKNNEKEIK